MCVRGKEGIYIVSATSLSRRTRVRVVNCVLK